jgi:hypothetical protein
MMESLLRKLHAGWKLRRVHRALEAALALHRRAEVRPDGLSMIDNSVALKLSWRARDVHPWDRDLSEEKIAPRLVDQTMHDAEDAIERIFKAFPEATTLDLKVLKKEPDCNQVIMSGQVARSELGRFDSVSIAMRLRMLGINYRLVGHRFETIGTSELPMPPVTSRVDFQLGGPVAGVQRPAHLTIKSRPRWPESERQ